MKRTKSPVIYSIAVILIWGSQLGCATMGQMGEDAKVEMNMLKEDEQTAPPVGRMTLPAVKQAEGSLWSEETGDMYFVDNRARRVGDIITVDIVENSSSKLDANTELTRDNSYEADIGYLMGIMRSIEASNSNINSSPQGSYSNKLLSANVKSEYSGEADTDRSGKVTASIAARVTGVLENGNLMVFGKREMKVNNEVQIITVSGILRDKDISQDNRIKSTYLSDSRIEYYGEGDLADKQRPGWLARMLDVVWPF
ncbi:MAG: flagellar basal body L-ring protein FlgH [Desulfobacterales bacterium]|nr:flagellar basal body L-ring protein FlgH [Desulfobacterales bacterium]